MRGSLKALTLAMLAAVMAPAGAAEDVIPNHPALNDRFYLAIGAFRPKTTTTAKLDSTRTGIGANIDLENALGISQDDTIPGFIARWRITNRWRVEAQYYAIEREAVRSIDREIRFGDRVFPINASIETRFDFADLRVSVGYALFRTVDKELGVGLGLHTAKYDLSLSAPLVGSQTGDVTAPLPVLSVYGQFALTERWAVATRLDRFSLSYDKYDGSLTALSIDLMYQPFRHVGFGLAERSLYLSVTKTDENRALRFQQALEGPMFYVNVSF
jgi:hypothetical protein